MPPQDKGTPDENDIGNAPANQALQWKDKSVDEGAQLAPTPSPAATSDEAAHVNPRKCPAVERGDANIAVACRKSIM